MNNRPKRRKSDDNPYTLEIINNTNIIIFKDSRNKIQTIEVSNEVYNQMNQFELEDISQMHKIDKYIERFTLSDEIINKRSVKIPESIENIVEKNKIRRQNDKTYPFKDYNYIICSTYGNPRSKDFHFEYWKNLLKECGLPNIRFHDLRATYTTLLLKNNFSAKAVSTLLGHSKEMITMDVYGDNEEIIADCVDELNDFINDVLPEQKIIVRDESDFCIDDELINELVIF